MNQAIRDRARQLGFDDCRITSAAAPQSAPRLMQWLAEQRQGQMAYLARNAHKRVDPQAVLPGVKSIIALAVSYGETRRANLQARRPAADGTCDAETRIPQSGAEDPASSDVVGLSGQQTGHAQGSALVRHGLIARYARHQDYHKVLAEPLKALAQFVDQLGGEGTRSLWYVDTGPVLERDLAQRAGLGFIGKHTNLISRQLGNWILLAEILTTLELEPEPPERNHCGSCSRCLAACPTGAILAPFELDARRCISYLTIELKGAIPVEARAAIGNRIYGCDDCLAVCPWNRFAREGALMRAQARPELTRPDLMELLALDDAQFKRRFAATPIERGKRRGLRRNVCVALGNTGDESALGVLSNAAQDPEPLIAEHALWAIAQIQDRARRASSEPAAPARPQSALRESRRSPAA